jgi:hypothetical protein
MQRRVPLFFAAINCIALLRRFAQFGELDAAGV